MKKICNIETAVICVLLVLARAAISYCIISDLYENILTLLLFLAFHVDYKFKLKVCVGDDICEHPSTEQRCIYVWTMASLRTTYESTALVINEMQRMIENLHKLWRESNE